MSQMSDNSMRQDFYIGAFSLVFGLVLYFWLIPGWVEDADFTQSSPRLFPNLTAIAISLIGTSLMIKNFRALRRSGSCGLTSVGVEVVFWMVVSLLTLLGTLHVGFVIANAIICFACIFFAGQRQHLPLVALFSVVFPLLLNLFAANVFDVVLP